MQIIEPICKKLSQWASHLSGRTYRITYDRMIRSLRILYAEKTGVLGGHYYSFKRPFMITAVRGNPNEKLYIEDRNALTGQIKSQRWEKHYRYHRREGPAVIQNDTEEFYLFGQKLSVEEFLQISRLSDTEILVHLIRNVNDKSQQCDLIDVLRHYDRTLAKTITGSMLLVR